MSSTSPAVAEIPRDASYHIKKLLYINKGHKLPISQVYAYTGPIKHSRHLIIMMFALELGKTVVF